VTVNVEGACIRLQGSIEFVHTAAYQVVLSIELNMKSLRTAG